MKVLDKVAVVLLIIGGLNWGLVGFFKMDLIAMLCGQMSVCTRIIYSLVGLSALYRIVEWKALPKRWKKK